MTTYIGTVAQLQAWDGSGTAELTADLTITSSDSWTVKNITGTFDGKYHTIVINNLTNYKGLFEVTTDSTVIIQNLLVHMLNSTFLTNANTGGILRSLNLNNNFIHYNVSVINCAGNGTFDMSNSYCGGLIGMSYGGNASIINIENCYFTGDDGCLFYHLYTNNASYAPTLTINKCFSTGKNSGIVNIAGGNITVQNCYISGNVDYNVSYPYAVETALFRMFYGYGNCNIINCYHGGNVLNASGKQTKLLVGTYTSMAAGDLNLTNCFACNATTNHSTSNVIMSWGVNEPTTTTNTTFGNGSWTNSTLSVSSIYDTAVNPPRLEIFKTTPWDITTYTNANETVLFLGSNKNLYTTSNNPLCLTENNTILTPIGYIKITELKVGDKVTTDDDRIVNIKDIIKFTVKGTKRTYPYIIEKDSIEKGYPKENSYISGGHLIYYKNQWIIPRECGLFEQDKSEVRFNYYHIELENYETDNLVINEGLVVESYGGETAIARKVYKERCKNLFAITDIDIKYTADNLELLNLN